MVHSLLLWSSHCLLCELAVLQSSFLLFPLSVASAGCGAGDLKLSSPLTGQVRMLLEENATLQVGLRKEKTRQEKTRKEKKRKYYTFWRQFNEKTSVIPVCPGRLI